MRLLVNLRDQALATKVSSYEYVRQEFRQGKNELDTQESSVFLSQYSLDSECFINKWSKLFIRYNDEVLDNKKIPSETLGTTANHLCHVAMPLVVSVNNKLATFNPI